MDTVIIISSDSDEDDSDLEIVGYYSNVTVTSGPLPTTAKGTDVNDTSAAEVSNVSNCFCKKWQTSSRCRCRHNFSRQPKTHSLGCSPAPLSGKKTSITRTVLTISVLAR